MRETHLASFEQDAAALVSVLRSAPLDLPVPSCPGWQLGDVGKHVGQVHRWAAAALEGQAALAQQPVPLGEDLAGWVEDGSAVLHRLLVGTDPDAPRWGLGPEPQTAAFWVRRQAHEIAMHRWDAEDAAGRPAALAADLALDGMGEVAEILYPRQVRLGRREPLGAAVELVTPQGRALLGEGPPIAWVHGPAETLMLVLWGRRDTSRLLADGTLRVDGDVTEASRLLGEQLVP